MGRVWDFLGLVEDEDAWTPSPPQPITETRPASSGNVRLITGSPTDSSTAPTVLRPESPPVSFDLPRQFSQEAETEVLQIDGFGDCQHLTSWYKSGVPVVLDLRSVPAEIAQGVVYYATGLISYNQGEVSQVGDGLVLVVPPRVVISTSEKRRLAKIGMWPTGDL